MSTSQRFTRTLVAQPSYRPRPGTAIAFGLLLLVTLALGGCAQPAAIAVVQPTATQYPPPTDIPAPSPGPTPQALDFPLTAPSQEPPETASDDQGCVDCHTDEETLKAVAEKEEEVEESLSEGEG